MLKSNFRKNSSLDTSTKDDFNKSEQSDLTKEEFEEFILKSGAKGSFMIYRSKNQNDELGIDEL